MPDDMMMEGWIEPESAWDGSALYGEEAFYVGLRHALPVQYAGLTTEQLGGLAAEAMARMTPEEAEDFENWLSDIGKAVSKVVKTVAPVAAKVLPVAAPIVGTLLGGPAGAAIAQFAGQALSGGVAAPAAGTIPMPGVATAAVPPVPPAAPGAVGIAAPGAPAVGAGASSATAQLMSFLQNPELLLSIARQLLGVAAPSAAPAAPAPSAAAGGAAPGAAPAAVAPATAAGAGEQFVPAFGEMMNALSVLAEQAASESIARYPRWSAESTPYLTSDTGGLYYDPVVPEERAAALLEQLRAGRANGRGSPATDDVTAWLAQAGLLA